MRFIAHGTSGIELSIDDQISSPRVIKEIEAGTYEQREMTFTQRIVSKGDRVLELGAGLGFVSTVINRRVNVGFYAAVEADARLIPNIKRSHEKNGIRGVEVINSAFVADQETLTLGFVEFGVSQVFWGSGISKAGQDNVTTVSVEAESASEYIHKHSINVLVLDIEGGELDLFRHLDLGGVEKIIMEIHPNVFGQAGTREIFNILDRNNFSYNAPNSAGPVVTFEKITSV